MSTQTHRPAKVSKMFYGPGEWGGGARGPGVFWEQSWFMGASCAFRRAWDLAACSLVTLLKIHNNF